MILAFIVDAVGTYLLPQNSPTRGFVISIVDGALFLVAVSAGVVALFGVRKHGPSGLLWKGLVSVIVPVLLAVLAIPAILVFRKDALRRHPDSILSDTSKGEPTKLDASSKGALDAARLFSAALQNQNADALVDAAPAVAVRRSGGREKMIEKIKADDVFQTITVIEFTFSEPTRIQSKDSTVYIVSYDMEALYKKNMSG